MKLLARSKKAAERAFAMSKRQFHCQTPMDILILRVYSWTAFTGIFVMVGFCFHILSSGQAKCSVLD